MNDKSHAVTPTNATPHKPKLEHTTDIASFVVSGNWGKLQCHADTGMVLEYDRSNSDSVCASDGYHDIARIDIPTFRKQWGYPDVSEIDILLVGFWTKDGKYEPPIDATPRAETITKM